MNHRDMNKSFAKDEGCTAAPCASAFFSCNSSVAPAHMHYKRQKQVRRAPEGIASTPGPWNALRFRNPRTHAHTEQRSSVIGSPNRGMKRSSTQNGHSSLDTDREEAFHRTPPRSTAFITNRKLGGRCLVGQQVRLLSAFHS